MQIVQSAVYMLCLVTSLLCAVLLVRGYWRNSAKLLLWSALCFVGLAVSNLFLFVDVVVFPGMNLLPLRHLSTLAAIAVLIYGFVWETE
jgi:hypothetical protein